MRKANSQHTGLNSEVLDGFLTHTERDALSLLMGKLDPKRRERFLQRVEKITNAYQERSKENHEI